MQQHSLNNPASRFVKAQTKQREASPTKKSRRDRNTSGETLGHELTGQVPWQTRPLGEILSTAEMSKRKQRPRNRRSTHLQLRLVEQTRRGNRHGSSSEQKYWASMRDHFEDAQEKDSLTQRRDMERRSTSLGTQRTRSHGKRCSACVIL